MNDQPIAPTRAEIRREQLLDACERMMIRVGFREMSMDDVAIEAGVSRRTIYYHFKTKADLGLSSIGRVVEAARQEMEREAALPRPYAVRLRKVLTRRVLTRLEKVRPYASSLDELFEVVRGEYLRRRKEYFQIEIRLIKKLIQQAMDANEFRECPPRRTAESILYATNSFIPYSLTPEEIGNERQVLAQLNSVLDLIIPSLLIDT